MAAKWYTKEEAAEIERKSQEKEIRRQERLNREKQEKERREEAKQNTESRTRVVLIDRFASQTTKRKRQSASAVYQANRKATMSEDDKKCAREKDKIRQREKRMEESIYETTDDQKLAGASRMSMCRHKKDEKQKKEENEKAKLGMRENRKRKKEEIASEDGYWYASRTKHTHPIIRKNVRRELRYIKETNTCEELINYFNIEKQEWLYMDPNGVHYRKKHYDVAHVDDDNDYEEVDLDIKDYMDLLANNNSRK